MPKTSFQIISLTQFGLWVERIDFATYLPTWVEMLVRASSGDHLQVVKFYSEEEAQRAGYDGQTQLAVETDRVPGGEAMWELGKTKDVRDKAESEYLRVADHLNASDPDRSKNITFVFVTPRQFPRKNPKVDKKTEEKKPPDRFNERTVADWIAARKSENIYRDVKVIEASDLVKWTNALPDVAMAVRREFDPEHFTPGLRDVEQVLREYLAGFANPAIDAAILLCGRSDVVDEVLPRFATNEVGLANPGRTDIYANTAEEALAFAAAVASEYNWLSGDTASERGANEECPAPNLPAIILTDSDTVQSFADRSNAVILLEGDAIKAAHRVEDRNAVICCHALDAETAGKATVLRDPSERRLSEYLEGRGIPDSARLAAMAGGALMTLRRLGGLSEVERPAYANATAENLDMICAATLLGAWDEKSVFDGKTSVTSLDQVTIETALKSSLKVDGHAFRQFKIALRDHRDLADGKPAADRLLKRVDDSYFLKAPVDAIDRLVHRFEPEHFEFFETMLSRVFYREGETEADPDEPFATGRTYSGTLRRGLALNLCILAYRGAEQDIQVRGLPIQEWANRQLNKLIAKHGFSTFVRHEDSLLGYFCEAAPQAFLHALEAEIQSCPDGISAMLTLEEDAFSLFPSNRATGLMFALSRLGWRERYFADVVRIVISLHALDPDPEANMHPRPRDVFYKFYVGFSPQTEVNYETRMRAVEALPTELEAATLDCLIASLPRGRMTVTSTGKPRFGPVDRPRLTYRDVWAANDAMFEAVLIRIPRHPQRVVDIISHLDEIRDDAFPKSVAHLSNVIQSCERDVQRDVWEALRRETARHRKFPDSDWSMPSSRLDRLEAWRDELALDDSERLLWLFSANWLQDFTTVRKDHGEALRTERQKVAREALEQNGVPAFLEKAQSVKEPGLLGNALAESGVGLTQLSVLIEAALKDPLVPDLFYKGLSRSAYHVFKEDWLEILFSASHVDDYADAVVTMAAILPLETAVADRFAPSSPAAGLAEAYWQNVDIWIFHGDRVETSIIDNLLAHGRQAELLTGLHQKFDVLDDEQLVTIARGFFDSFISVESNRRPSTALEDMFALLKNLKERAALPLQEIASHEFPLAPRFRFHHDPYPYAIHELITSDPGEFVQMLAFQYKTDPAHPATQDADEDEIKVKGKLSWHVLNTVAHPGLLPDVATTPVPLKTWIDGVRDEASRYDLIDIADFHIGSVLSQSAEDPNDDIWPPAVVREVLESHGNSRLFEGFRNREYNERGVYSDGPVHFTRLAERFQTAAEGLLQWPKTRFLLQKMAEQAHADAQYSRLSFAKRDAQSGL